MPVHSKPRVPILPAGEATPAHNTASEETRGDSGGEDAAEDELDRLLDAYEAEADAARRSTEYATAPAKDPTRMGMAALRDEGLTKPLAPESRGFQMLARMGYREGGGLGRSGDGRAAPLELVVKAKRTGLGVDEAAKRKREESAVRQEERAARRARGAGEMQASFQSGRATYYAERRAAGHLMQARKACETLDRRTGMESSAFWPRPPKPVPDEEEVLGKSIGVAPPIAEDQTAEVIDLEPEESEDEGDGWEAQPTEQKLDEVVSYLRQRYFYCVFCGHQAPFLFFFKL